MVERPVTVRDGKTARRRRPLAPRPGAPMSRHFAGTSQADVLFPVLEYL